jgi:putative Mg2+ transporter-C (MgtC) family protein
MDSASIPTEFSDLFGRLALAIVMGALIGVDRELQHKPAGLRTHALVALGACLMTVVGLMLAGAPTMDFAAPGRILQGIIAGVGFIGGGAIFRQGDGSGNYGLTTAATIWIVAAVGTAAGAGLWRTTLSVTVLVVLLLLLDAPIDRLFRRRDN